MENREGGQRGGRGPEGPRRQKKRDSDVVVPTAGRRHALAGVGRKL